MIANADPLEHQLEEVQGQEVVAHRRQLGHGRVLRRIGDRHPRPEAAADNLDGVAIQAQSELLGREIANQALKDLALQGEPAAAMDLGRALGHDGHVEVGGDHPQTTV